MKKIIFKQLPDGAYLLSTDIFNKMGCPIVSYGMPCEYQGLSIVDFSRTGPSLYKREYRYCILPVDQPQIYAVDISSYSIGNILKKIRDISEKMYSGFDCNNVVIGYWHCDFEGNPIMMITRKKWKSRYPNSEFRGYSKEHNNSYAWCGEIILGFKTLDFGYCDNKWEIVYEKL